MLQSLLAVVAMTVVFSEVADAVAGTEVDACVHGSVAAESALMLAVAMRHRWLLAADATTAVSAADADAVPAVVVWDC